MLRSVWCTVDNSELQTRDILPQTGELPQTVLATLQVEEGVAAQVLELALVPPALARLVEPILVPGTANEKLRNEPEKLRRSWTLFDRKTPESTYQEVPRKLCWLHTALLAYHETNALTQQALPGSPRLRENLPDPDR